MCLFLNNQGLRVIFLCRKNLRLLHVVSFINRIRPLVAESLALILLPYRHDLLSVCPERLTRVLHQARVAGLLTSLVLLQVVLLNQVPDFLRFLPNLLQLAYYRPLLLPNALKLLLCLRAAYF